MGENINGQIQTFFHSIFISHLSQARKLVCWALIIENLSFGSKDTGGQTQERTNGYKNTVTPWADIS